eukprot:9490802-Pyramimonas_sp.AAC.1
MSDLKTQIQGLTLSTCFSGIGAPEVALASVFRGLQYFSNRGEDLAEFDRPICLWAVDKSRNCRR